MLLKEGDIEPLDTEMQGYEFENVDQNPNSIIVSLSDDIFSLPVDPEGKVLLTNASIV